MMKAIIQIARRGRILDAALADVDNEGSDDYVLSFESARTLFSEVTPARLDLLDALRRVGPCSVYALAKAVARNYSNVHGDVVRLIDLGLVERAGEDAVRVPFEAVEIHMPLTRAA